MILDTIDYLQQGTSTQRKVHELLCHHGIMDKLHSFDPVLTGTIPLNISIETSDLDIVCCWKSEDDFMEAVTRYFAPMEGFAVCTKVIHGHQTIVANFRLDDFDVEIFGQGRPVREQESYRHMIIEFELLIKYGEEFRRAVVELKRQGLKTEPAFAKLLKLPGIDPYQELLKLSAHEYKTG
jgi:hypothetical protein